MIYKKTARAYDWDSVNSSMHMQVHVRLQGPQSLAHVFLLIMLKALLKPNSLISQTI